MKNKRSAPLSQTNFNSALSKMLNFSDQRLSFA